MDHIEINATLGDYAERIEYLRGQLEQLDQTSASYKATLEALQATEQEAASATEAMASATESIQGASETTGTSFTKLGSTITGLGKTMSSSGGQFTKLGGAIAKFGPALGIATGGIKTFIKGWKALTAALNTNPIMLAVTAVVALGSALWSFYKDASEAEEEAKQQTREFYEELRKARDEFEAFRQETMDLDTATRKLAGAQVLELEVQKEAILNAKEGSQERIDLINNLIEHHEELQGTLDAETATNEDVINSIDTLKDSVVEYAEAQARTNAYLHLYEEYLLRSTELQRKQIELDRLEEDTLTSATEEGKRKLLELREETNQLRVTINETKNDMAALLAGGSFKIGDQVIDIGSGEIKNLGGHKGGSGGGGGHHRTTHHSSPKSSSRRSSTKSSREPDPLKELSEEWEDLLDGIEASHNLYISLIENNIGAAGDFENRSKEAIESTTDFEIAQIDRRKIADDTYYSDTITTRTKYLAELEKLEKQLNEKLSSTKDSDTKSKLEKQLKETKELITKNKNEIQVLESTTRKNSFETISAVDARHKEILEKRLEDVSKNYETQLKDLERKNDIEIAKVKQVNEKEEAIEQKSAEAQRKYLYDQFSTYNNYLYNMLAAGAEASNETVKEIRAKIQELLGEIRQFKTPLEELQDQIKNINLGDAFGDPMSFTSNISNMMKQLEDMGDAGSDAWKKLNKLKNLGGALATTMKLTDALGSVGEAWKMAVEKQVEAGEISEEEAQERFKKIQAMEISIAIVNTIAGAIAAFMGDRAVIKGPWGYAIGIADMLATLAAGYAQVQQIRQATFGGGSGSSGPNVIVGQATPLLNEAQDINQLDMLSAGTEQPDQRVYVVESDITDAQNRQKVRVQDTTF